MINSEERNFEKQPQNSDINTLTDAVRKVNITHEDLPKNRRRVVNNHLYTHKNDIKNSSKVRNELVNANETFGEQKSGWSNETHIEQKNVWSNDLKYQNPASLQKHQQRSDHYQHTNDFSNKRNTETFKPSHKPPEMRILISPPGCQRYSREITSRDLLIVNDLFCNSQDLSIYEELISETEKCGVESMDLWQLWHGDSHMIADDKKKWKEYCPTFLMVLDKIRDFFQMDIKATRLNWYRDSNEWKPFHHDAAAIKADKARSQNLTVAVSFGAERDAAFEHAQTKTIISLPQPNGTIYTFGKDVNIIWRHGILQVPPDKYHNKGRISIIAWGWIDNMVNV